MTIKGGDTQGGKAKRRFGGGVESGGGGGGGLAPLVKLANGLR
jgi:hypothetical protein